MNIQEVISPGGISAWLVEEHRVPLIAMRFAFAGGCAQDPAEKPGVANFVSVMLDEGAGTYSAQQYQERQEELALRMSFSAGRDSFYGNFETLAANLDPSAELLKLALTEPTFDEAAVERLRGQLLTNLAFAEKDPRRVTQWLWSRRAYPDHPYGRPTEGTTESVTSISGADLKSYVTKVFARSDLKVAVVGAIGADALGRLLDQVFGDLPETPDLQTLPATTLGHQGETEVIQMPVPQSVVLAGLPGILRNDPDYVPAFVMNHILGGGTFSSKLMTEVREKRGLAYSVSSHLSSHEYAGALIAQFATKNESVREAIDVTRNQMTLIAEQGVSDEELRDAKSYLTGSYPLRFDTNGKIATQLLGIQLENLGMDYPDIRNDLVNAVTRDDIQRVAKNLLVTEKMMVAVVGEPQNLT